MAKLHFKYGTMNSGKSLDLIKTIYNYEETGNKVLLLKPKVDTKGLEYITSRNGMNRKVDLLVDKDTNLINEVIDRIDSDTKCVLVDEAQFLTKEQIDQLFLISKEVDMQVICYGLRNNFKMEGFAGSIRLLEIAEILEELPTLCKCGHIARYVGRKVDDEFVYEGEEVIIDGANTNIEYVPLCGKCYLEKVKKIKLVGKDVVNIQDDTKRLTEEEVIHYLQEIEDLVYDKECTDKALKDKKIDYNTKRDYENDIIADNRRISEITEILKSNGITPNAKIKKKEL